MARTIDTIGNTRESQLPQSDVYGFTGSSPLTAADLTGLFGNILGGIGTLNTGSGGSKSNFNLNKSVQLKDIDLQKQELLRQQSAGLRDIGQARVEGLRAAVNNALQRGIFHSGIREFNEARVEREAGEAKGDLQGRIGIALERLMNQRRGTAGQKFTGGGSAGGGGGLTSSDIVALFTALFGLTGGSGGVEE